MTTIEMMGLAANHLDVLSYEMKAASYVAKEIAYCFMSVGIVVEHRQSKDDPYLNHMADHSAHCWIQAGYAMIGVASILSISSLACSGVGSQIITSS